MARPSRDGLTLVEVLVVVAILVILVGLFLPARRRVGGAATRTMCQNNLRQVMIGLHCHEPPPGPAPSAADPGAPVALVFPPGCSGPGVTPDERLSWMATLLPYIEEAPLFQRFDAGKGYAGNVSAAETKVRVFICPAGEPTAGAVTHYVALAGLGHDAAGQPTGAPGNGFMGSDRRTSFATITDGASNTVALIETRAGLGPWARGGISTVRGFDPADLPLTGDGRPFGGHPGVIVAAMADGSTRVVRAAVDPAKLAAAVTIAGGESPAELD